MRLLLLVSLFFVVLHSLPPPEGLKRAKQVGNEEEPVEPPPNLQLRSRMMAAMNSHAQPISPEKAGLYNQPLILTKNKKSVKPAAKAILTQTITASTENPSAPHNTVTAPSSSAAHADASQTREDIRKKFSSVGDEKVNLNIRPVLKTNFVDANGKVVRDVVSVPIRVSDGHIHSIPKNAKNATSSASVVETEKNVNVAFRSSLPLWLF